MADRIMVVRDGRVESCGSRMKLSPCFSLTKRDAHVWTGKEETAMKLDAVTDGVLSKIDDLGFKQEGAFNLRYNGQPLCTVIRSISKSAGRG